MIRPVLSYILSGLILVTQVGIPLHKHYCKGILESVSVFYAASCDDHDSPAVSDSCCKKEGTATCSTENNSCCSHEVTVVSQQGDYVTSQTEKWISPALTPVAIDLPVFIYATPSRIHAAGTTLADTGPPLYILHQSLIIYA